MGTGVFLAGTRQLFRAGLARILEREQFVITGDDFTIPAEVPSGTDVVILDASGGVASVEPDVRRLKDARPDVRLVIIAAGVDSRDLQCAFDAGADGYLLEQISPDALRESLRLVLVGEQVLPSQVVSLLRRERMAMPATPGHNLGGPVLSDREGEIIMRLAGGMPNKVIASELAITEATVKGHLKSILKKLGFSNRTQVAVWAISRGLPLPGGRSAA